MERAVWSQVLGVLMVLLVAAGCGDEASPRSAADAGAEDVATDTREDVAADTDTDMDAGDVGVEVVEDADVADVPEVPPSPAIEMDFMGSLGDFYAAPFPSQHRRVDGRITMAGFPGVSRTPLVQQLVELIERDADGFGVSSGVFFRADVPLDVASLPGSFEASVAPGASVLLVGIDEAVRGQRVPISVKFEADGGPFGAQNQLAVLPLQGVVLGEGMLYAAVVTTEVRAESGEALETWPGARAVARGEDLVDLSFEAGSDYRSAIDILDGLGVAPEQIAGLAVFRTGSPTSGLRAAREAILARPRPRLEAGWEAKEVFADLCVYEGVLPMPTYQEGEPPFMLSGGGWARDAAGELVVQREERSRIVVTIPRQPMPAGGYPGGIFVRTGGGGDRPLVDRGVRDAEGVVLEPGSGPAVQFASAGWAAVSVDGPHGGLRNVTGGDEQFIIFNILNPLAMRDNIRESALELMLVAHLLDDIAIDVSGCEGAVVEGGGLARLDVSHLALMGHSMGATIGPLAVATEPRFRAAILSGAGGSWIENVVFKRSPVEVAPLAELVLGYQDRRIHEHDPVLNLLQWAGEPADPMVYAHRLIHRPYEDAAPRHVLMFQGIADTYILPPIANALSLALGVDLAGPALDVDHPVTGAFTGLEALLPWSGRSRIALPASGNLSALDQPWTGVVVQHLEDGVEDGHEVVFQTPAPKARYACFLRTLAAGRSPVVPGEGGCPEP